MIDGIRNQIIINPAYATNFPAELHKSHKRIQLSKFQTDIIINILDYLQGTGKIWPVILTGYFGTKCRPIEWTVLTPVW